MSDSRKWTILAAAALTIVATPPAVGVWWSFADRHSVRQESFDAVAWKQADPLRATKQDGWRTARSRMIEDLLEQYDFSGWTRRQVVDLLGSPTGEWSGFQQWDMIYVLGRERAGSFSLDDESLGFNFDSTDRVTKYGLSVN